MNPMSKISAYVNVVLLLEIDTAAALVKKNLARCLLKTKWLMKRNLVKGGNSKKRDTLFWSINKCLGPSCFVKALDLYVESNKIKAIYIMYLTNLFSVT